MCTHIPSDTIVDVHVAGATPGAYLVESPGEQKVPPAHVGLEFASAFEVRLVEETTARWEFWLGLLSAFVEREGHCRIPWSHEMSGSNLGGWCLNRRVDRKAGKLGAEKIADLDALGSSGIPIRTISIAASKSWTRTSRHMGTHACRKVIRLRAGSSLEAGASANALLEGQGRSAPRGSLS